MVSSIIIISCKSIKRFIPCNILHIYDLNYSALATQAELIKQNKNRIHFITTDGNQMSLEFVDSIIPEFQIFFQFTNIQFTTSFQFTYLGHT